MLETENGTIEWGRDPLTCISPAQDLGRWGWEFEGSAPETVSEATLGTILPPARVDIEIEVEEEVALNNGEHAHLSLPEPEGSSLDRESFSFNHAGAPQERIRFVTPVSLWGDGFEFPIEGAIINLSDGGVACVVPFETMEGEALTLEFALELGAEPARVCGEVMWRRNAGPGQWLLGVRFMDLDTSVAEEIGRLVSERNEGISSSLSVPHLETEIVLEEGSVKLLPERSWKYSMFGAMMGLAVAFVLPTSFYFSDSSDGESSLPPLASSTPAATSTAKIQTKAVISPLGQRSAASSNLEKLKSVQKPKTSQGELKVTSIARDARVAAQAPKPGKPTAPSSPNTLAPSAPAVGGDANTFDLELLTGGPVERHVHFWLESPRRLVIDIPGHRSQFEKKDYELDHPLASRLRIGKHPDKVRFVIETAGNVASRITAQQRDTGLGIVLHRRSS